MKKIIIGIVMLILAVPTYTVVKHHLSEIYTSSYNQYMREAKEQDLNDGWTYDGSVTYDDWVQKRIKNKEELKTVHQDDKSYITSRTFLDTLWYAIVVLFFGLFVLFAVSLIITIICLDGGEIIGSLFSIGAVVGGTYVAYKVTKKVASGISDALPDNAKTALVAGAAAAITLKAAEGTIREVKKQGKKTR